MRARFHDGPDPAASLRPRLLSALSVLLLLGAAPEASFGQSDRDAEPCDRIDEIRRIPMKNETIEDTAYHSIIDQGDRAIPCLIDRITDITAMPDPRTAPTYAAFVVGDLAYFLLIELTGEPFLAGLPAEAYEGYREHGVYTYFGYVSEAKNRDRLQAVWRKWWTNAAPSDESSSRSADERAELSSTQDERRGSESDADRDP